MSYLSIEHLTKRYGAQPVLRGVALDVQSGEFVSLLGTSGCGKSTLLRIVCGIETADTGTIRFQGQDITRTPASRRRFGIVFQSYALFPNLTVAQNVAYGLPAGERGSRALNGAHVRELLERVGLGDKAAKFPAQLSGGQQQRVALARALAPGPQLLLLDEPLSALDAQVRAGLRSEIRRLQRELGITTVMVTHDQDEALSMADRVVVMDKGVIAQQGSPQQLYAHPASPFVAGFVGKMNLMPGLVTRQGCVRVGQADIDCDTSPLRTGSPLMLGIRPESVCLRPGGERLPFAAVGAQAASAVNNRWPATVTETHFLGHRTLVRLDCADLGAQLEAELPTPPDASLPDWLHASVTVELPSSALSVLDTPMSVYR